MSNNMHNSRINDVKKNSKPTSRSCEELFPLAEAVGNLNYRKHVEGKLNSSQHTSLRGTNQN